MYNLLISLAVGLAVGVAIVAGTTLGPAAAIFPALLAATIAYFVLARRTWGQLTKIFDAMQAEVRAQKLDKAVQTLHGGFRLAPWQFLVAAQLHSNIGMLHYLKGDLEAALPHLEKSFSRNWIARGMLGAARYRKRDLEGARRVLEDAVKVNKKEGVLWSLYAWILEAESRHDDAIAVLSRGVAANGSDEKLKASLVTLQNGKKLKLGKTYGETWWQFMLERPPPQFVGGPGGFRGNKRALYGR